MNEQRQYRGITKDGKLVKGWYAEMNGEPLIYSATEKPWLSHKVIPETVGQSTGLKDKKRTEEFPEGQEIFKGDKFKLPGDNRVYEVIFHLGGYVLYWHEDNCYLHFNVINYKEGEVIKGAE